MKILHLISQTPDFTGSGKLIQQIMGRAGEKGNENYLLAGCQGDFLLDPALVPPDRAVLVRFDGRDLPFAVAGMSDVMPYESTVFSRMSRDDLGAYARAFRQGIETALRRFTPDLIHSHHLWMVSAWARQLSESKAIPMVTTCHGTCLRQHRLNPEISRQISPALKRIDQVMALSRSQQDQIVQEFGFPRERVPVVTGGFDASLFRPQAKRPGRVEIVYAGKLSRAKGVPWLLKSLQRILDLDFCLHLAGGGSGPETRESLDLAATLKDRVKVHGPLSHPDLARLMGDAHLFVLPSFFEGVPLVMLEALASGCRILCTDLPGVRQILPKGENSMVRLISLPPLESVDRPFAADEPVLEARLSRMLKEAITAIARDPNPDLAFARQASAPYVWEKVFERIEGVYDAALAGAGTGAV